MFEMNKLARENPMNWWNKLRTMTESEMKLLPYAFLKKYSSYIHFMKRMEREAKV